MKRNEIVKNVFSVDIQKPANYLQRNDSEFNKMRGWQISAFNKLKDAPYMILNAPMGSGKSWLMCLLSAYKMKKNPSLRTIIAVPQTVIAPGFIDAKFLMPDEETIHWSIQHNLCGQSILGTCNYFIQWLEQETDVFSERTILCTHATLVAVYKKLKKGNRLDLMRNLLVWIDEAHHVKNVAIEGFNDVISNNLGSLVSFFLNEPSTNVQLGLTTASFFRGDRASLLTDEMETKFQRFNLGYDEYLKSMSYLRSFSYDFVFSGPAYLKGIELVLKSGTYKDIIYIPHTTSQYSTGNKYQEVSDVINLYGNIIETTPDGLIIVAGNGHQYKILDLVSEKKRKLKKGYLDNPVIKKQREALDAIITMGMFKEGANWIYAERIIIVGARTSLVDVIQMVGRLFRDVEGKEHVQVVHLLPFELDEKNEEQFRENLNDYLKAIYASLILENILNPVKIRTHHNKDTQIDNDSEYSSAVSWLDFVLPDEAKKLSLIADVTEQILEDVRNLTHESNCYEQYMKKIPAILEANGIKEFHNEIANELWTIWERRNSKDKKLKSLTNGLLVQDIDFDIVEKGHPLEFLLRYTSGLCGIDTFEKLRKAIQASKIKWRPFDEARVFIHGLGLKNIAQWRDYVANKLNDLSALPTDIPRAPWIAYANAGWISLGDWLGTGVMATRLRKYLPFHEARDYVRTFQLKNRDEWDELKKNKLLPSNIPAHPERTYKPEGWIDWADFIGSGKSRYKNRKILSFEEARNHIRSLGLKNQADWVRFSNSTELPTNIPRYPNEAYVHDGWTNLGDWIGTDRLASRNRKYKSFEEARSFVRSFSLKNNKMWREWAKSTAKPNDIPAAPDRIYANRGWIGWGDFLGTGNMDPSYNEFMEFLEVKDFIQLLGFKTRKDWEMWLKSGARPNKIPSNPSQVYRNQGWKGWGDFLGTGNIANFEKKFRSYEAARDFARSLRLKGKDDWFRWTKSGHRPSDIPTAPNRTYGKQGWTGWKDWLGK